MSQDIQKDDEIDLLALLQKIVQGKKTIFKCFLVFFVIGVFIAIFSKKEYTATSLVLAQENNAAAGGSLSGLASLAGINLSSGSSDLISPKLYTSIAQSIPFQRKMIQARIKVQQSNTPITYQEYYQKYNKGNFLDVIQKYTIGLPSLIVDKVTPSEESIPQYTASEKDTSEVYSLTPEESSLFGLLKSQLKITNNDKDNTVSLSFSMEDPVAAAQMLEQAKNYLQETIIEFKTRKAKKQLEFIQKHKLIIFHLNIYVFLLY